MQSNDLQRWQHQQCHHMRIFLQIPGFPHSFIYAFPLFFSQLLFSTLPLSPFLPSSLFRLMLQFPFIVTSFSLVPLQLIAVGVVFVRWRRVHTICAPRVKIGVNTSNATAATDTGARTSSMPWYLFE